MLFKLGANPVYPKVLSGPYMDTYSQVYQDTETKRQVVESTAVPTFFHPDMHGNLLFTTSEKDAKNEGAVLVEGVTTDYVPVDAEAMEWHRKASAAVIVAATQSKEAVLANLTTAIKSLKQ